jgi:single-strand DNA-binding protein
MASNNITTLIGNLTVDNPELRVSQSGKEVCSFSLGVNRGYGDKRRVIFPRFVAFGHTAEYVSKQKKGALIAVSCEYDIRDYEQSGTKKQSHEFTVLDLQVCKHGGTDEAAPQRIGDEQPRLEDISADDTLPF